MRVRLTITQINAFLRLAQLGGFRDAALSLGVSQPALSRTIQSIESRIGARLFDRNTHKVLLTPAGEMLRSLSKGLASKYDNAFAQFDDFVAGHAGRIRIATLPSVSAALLPAAIASFQPRHPSVRIDIWEDVSHPIHRAVQDDEADIGLATPPTSQRELKYRSIAKDEIVLVCRTDDPLVEDDNYGWTIFRDRPYISMSPESSLRSLVDSALVKAGLTIEPLYNCKQLTTIGSLIAASLGIAALPKLTLAQLASPVLTWRRLKPTLVRSIGIITRVSRSPSPATLAFLRELRAHAKLLDVGADPPRKTKMS